MVRPPYRAVVRLLGVGGHQWAHIDASRSDDLLDLRVDRFLNYIFDWFMQHLDEKGREKFLAELEMPLEGESPEMAVVSQETIEREMNDFDAVMGMMGRG